jgi:hypothetical protein
MYRDSTFGRQAGFWVSVICCAALSGPTGAGTHAFVGPTLRTLHGFNLDWNLLHEGQPSGVPTSYDWARKGRVTTGNQPPSGFSAITGWGQAFWLDGAGDPMTKVEIRQHQTYACLEPERRWVLLQSGPIAGAAFRTDFAKNVAKPPPLFEHDRDHATVAFAPDSAFHFWPKAGRAKLPDARLCGLLVLAEARAAQAGQRDARDDTARTGVLIGLGADYWLDRKARWDNFKTNKDVAVGRLRALTWDWQWYGLSTAPDPDLTRLFGEGFVDGQER